MIANHLRRRDVPARPPCGQGDGEHQIVEFCITPRLGIAWVYPCWAHTKFAELVHEGLDQIQFLGHSQTASLEDDTQRTDKLDLGNMPIK